MAAQPEMTAAELRKECEALLERVTTWRRLRRSHAELMALDLEEPRERPTLTLIRGGKADEEARCGA